MEQYTKIYMITREYKNGDTHVSEEAARFDRLSMASIMLKALCNEPNYKAEIDFAHLDCIWAVKAVWTGGGEAHYYQICEEYVDENGVIVDFFD